MPHFLPCVGGGMSKADQKGRHQLCTHPKTCQKTVTRRIWKDYEELAAMNLKKTGPLEMEGQRVGFKPTCSFLQTDFDRCNQVVFGGLGRLLSAHQIGVKA